MSEYDVPRWVRPLNPFRYEGYIEVYGPFINRLTEVISGIINRKVDFLAFPYGGMYDETSHAVAGALVLSVTYYIGEQKLVYELTIFQKDMYRPGYFESMVFAFMRGHSNKVMEIQAQQAKGANSD